jgi:7,8-dihydropterin-6-yl-methyl-4-(beta-D-ribofuranosyl)aminobenzene 5'-phosphate synthase
MQVDITILVENTTPVSPLIGEYGFAALLRVDERKILFDTGSANALFLNSAALGIKLDEIEAVLISHGHYDHTGALLPFIKQYGPKPIYAHSNIFSRRPMPTKRDPYREIGCVFQREEIEAAGAQLFFTDEFCEIFPGIYASGEVPRINDFEDVGGNFKVEIDGELIKDNLLDDMSLIIDHPDGLIIISGCAHAGIINILEHSIKQTGKSKILAFIGGTHLINASEERLTKTVSALKSYDIQNLIVSHCTGFYAAARLYNELGTKVVKGDTGMTFRF